LLRSWQRRGKRQPPSSDLGCGDNHRAAEIARRDLGPTRGRSLSFRVAKRFYVREPFCPWVLSRIEPAAPPGELGQWIWWVIRLDLAGKERCCGEDPRRRHTRNSSGNSRPALTKTHPGANPRANGELGIVDRDVGVAAADIPDAMRPHSLGRPEGDLARRLGMRDVEDADSRRILAAFQEIGRRSRLVGLRIDLHRPHARPVDGKQQVVMGRGIPWWHRLVLVSRSRGINPSRSRPGKSRR